MTHNNQISVQSMPRSPELRNLLDRTIAQLDNLNDAGVPATGRKIELYMIDNHLNSPCIEGIASAQPSYNQINAFRRREEPQASDAAIHMALNAFIGRMLTKERDIDACMCDDEYCKFAIDTSHRPQKRRRRSTGGDADGTDEPEGSGAAGHVAKHVLSALKAEMRLYDRALRQEARAERHVQNGQGSSGDSPAPPAPGHHAPGAGGGGGEAKKPGPKKGFKYSATHKVDVNGRAYTVPMRYTLINVEELNKLKAAAGAQILLVDMPTVRLLLGRAAQRQASPRRTRSPILVFECFITSIGVLVDDFNRHNW